MAENWLQKTIETPRVIDGLIARYGKERIDELTSGETFKDAAAAMALALSEALDQTNLSRRKRRAAGIAMIDAIMTGASVVFLLGHALAGKEMDGGIVLDDIAPDSSMGRWPKEYGRAQ